MRKEDIMDKKKDISKLFQEKFSNFSVENSPQIEAMMKQKIRKKKALHFQIKMITSVLIIPILSILVFILPWNDVELESNVIHEIKNKNSVQPLQPTIIEDDIPIIKNQEFDVIEVDNHQKNIPQKKNQPRQIVTPLGGDETGYHINSKNTLSASSNTNHENKLFLLEQKQNLVIQFESNRQLPIKQIQEVKNLEKVSKKKSGRVRVTNHKQRQPTHMIPSRYTGHLDLGLSAFSFNNSVSSILPTNDTIISSDIKEEPQLSYGFGLDFQLMNKQRPFFIGLGLHFQNYREKIDYQLVREYIDLEKSYWDCDSIFEYHINPPFFDTILARIDSNYMAHIVRNENMKSHINTYQYLNIPLLFGYQFSRPYSPFMFEFSVGMDLGILLKNQGYYYNNSGHIIDFSSNSTSVFLQYNLKAQIGLFYQWKKINFFARPYFQYQLNKNEWNTPLQGRKYMIYGLNFGLRLKLF